MSGVVMSSARVGDVQKMFNNMVEMKNAFNERWRVTIDNGTVN